jgi:hypothetical protein
MAKRYIRYLPIPNLLINHNRLAITVLPVNHA